MAAALANAAGTRFGITYTVTLLDNFVHALTLVHGLVTRLEMRRKEMKVNISSTKDRCHLDKSR